MKPINMEHLQEASVFALLGAVFPPCENTNIRARNATSQAS
jgi:hypothetical protein